MSLRFVFLLFFLSAGVVSYAADPFEGTFRLEVTSPQLSGPKAPLPMNFSVRKDHMMMEVEEPVKRNWLRKSVLIDLRDTTVTLIMDVSGSQRAVRTFAWLPDSMRLLVPVPKQTVRYTHEMKQIGSYPCEKIVVESEDAVAELWVTRSLQLDICKVYRLMDHCTLMNRLAFGGDWYECRSIPGMVLGVSSKDKHTGESYELSFSLLKPGKISEKIFSLDGFRITDVPSGQNCGASRLVKK